MPPPKLAILAGEGPLPGRIVAACRAQEREVFVVAHRDLTDPGAVDGVAHAWVRLGAVERTLALLHAEGAEEVVLAGPVPRPSLVGLGLDRRALKLAAGLAKGSAGDDRLLSLVVCELEREGFRVVGIDDLLDDVAVPAGPLGAVAPGDDALADVAVGCRVARALGAQDVGQAVVVQQGVVLGVEAIEGTDALLARCAGLCREGPGGVLVKLKKPGQEARADLPAIGPATVEGARAAGLAGIAVEAGAALVVDRAATAAAADAAGLFVYGVDPDAM